ncbi:hypothetical protein QAD02_006066 [Eretmocerus hayati]|uniref:Uncharacterized protein n=1 Tax=Eretmocerus hayati TaxID=131215 RepID=A0ACC2N003_9HYME|nr:hypothetical protein QAD02_006066 [Eretmocerus hayati]
MLEVVLVAISTREESLATYGVESNLQDFKSCILEELSATWRIFKSTSPVIWRSTVNLQVLNIRHLVDNVELPPLLYLKIYNIIRGFNPKRVFLQAPLHQAPLHLMGIQLKVTLMLDDLVEAKPSEVILWFVVLCAIAILLVKFILYDNNSSKNMLHM